MNLRSIFCHSIDGTHIINEQVADKIKLQSVQKLVVHSIDRVILGSKTMQGFVVKSTRGGSKSSGF